MSSKNEAIMDSATLVAVAEGYNDLSLRAGDWSSITRTKEVGDVLLYLNIYTEFDRVVAKVSHMPRNVMVTIESMPFSWPHKSFRRLFERPVLRIAQLYEAYRD